MPKGLQKDVGEGVFRDRDDKVIPRELFEEDAIDVNPPGPDTPEAVYERSLRYGLPRDPEVEASLDMEKVDIEAKLY